jgi:histidinol phosphatase-like PHP family hydrolase
MKILPYLDLHVHSDYSCCPVTMQEVMWDARLSGLRMIGFSDHYDKILDNSSFKKYYSSLIDASQKRFIDVKKGVEVELDDFEKLLKDIEQIDCKLDYIHYHNLRNFDDFCGITNLINKTKIPIIIAHPGIGYWETKNEVILNFIKKNNITIEINKTHLSYLSGSALSKEKEFFKILLKDTSINVSFGSDYHNYGDFAKTNSLFNQLWESIDPNRIFFNSKLSNSKLANLPDLNNWLQKINIKPTINKPIFSKDLIKDKIVMSKINLLNKLSENKSSELSLEIINNINGGNNTGLNMFYFNLLKKFCINNSNQRKKVIDLMFDNFGKSKIKDLRRYCYNLAYEIALIDKQVKIELIKKFETLIDLEKSKALQKKISKYLIKLNDSD